MRSRSERRSRSVFRTGYNHAVSADRPRVLLCRRKTTNSLVDVPDGRVGFGECLKSSKVRQRMGSWQPYDSGWSSRYVAVLASGTMISCQRSVQCRPVCDRAASALRRIYANCCCSPPPATPPAQFSDGSISVLNSIPYHTIFFSQPSIYIDGWLYGMRMTSVVCNVPVLSQNDSTYHHSVFTT